jgi:hypothetical protein
MAAAAAQLLGEDGRGYELARRLEACGAWRAWLGDDAAHAALAQHLTSPATWDAFLSPAASPSPPPRPLLLLQLRVRALLFDKASAALQLAPRGAGSAGLHSINANCECIFTCSARCSRHWVAGENLGICCSNLQGSRNFALEFREKQFGAAFKLLVLGFSGVIRGWLATCLVA